MLCSFIRSHAPGKGREAIKEFAGARSEGQRSPPQSLSLYLSHVVAIPHHFVTDPLLVYCLFSRVLSLFHVPGLYES